MRTPHASSASAPSEAEARLLRARGCLLGQVAGDSLGSLVESQSPEHIRYYYPDGVRELDDGGVWDTIAGQPTDDSEMALALARTLVACGTYSPAAVRKAYLAWFHSRPFDRGGTVSAALRGRPKYESQANGALMRASPLGIFGSAHPLERVAAWARQDAALTHPHRVCLEANALFCMAVAHAVAAGPTPADLYRRVVEWAEAAEVAPPLLEVVRGAADTPVKTHQPGKNGWVLIGFGNALWQLLHAPNLVEGVVGTVMGGGDTDTNGAICGALLGAVYGLDAVPEQWLRCVLRCRPAEGRPGVLRPRPRCYWPVDVLDVAALLATGGRRVPRVRRRVRPQRRSRRAVGLSSGPRSAEARS